MSETSAPRSRPAALWLLSALLLAETAALAAGTVAAVLRLVGGSTQPGPLVFLAVLAAAIAVMLTGALRGLWRGARWPRSPVLTLQILLVALSVGWIGVEISVWAVAALVGAVGAVVCLFLPAVVTWTTAGRVRT